MEKKLITYFDLINLIDQYIDQEGITKTCAHILTILGNRLSDKVKIMGPLIKEENDEPISSEGENHEKIS